MAKKWDCDTTSSEKLLLLFTTLLFNKRAFSLAELSSPPFLNASKPTTLRLLRQLEQSGAGMLIREKRGRESWFRLDHKSVTAPGINSENVALLALCRDLVLHLLPENMQMETAQILARLGARMKNDRSLSAVSLVKGRIDYAPYQKILSDIERAISKKLVCRVSYKSAHSDKAQAHLFAPLRLLASQDSMYIEGWLLEDDSPGRRKYADPLRLALQRFCDCELTQFSSASLPALPPAENSAFGLMECESFTAKIWFAADAANYICERSWSSGQKVEQQEDGSIILTLRMANFYEALSWVLGFGKKAIVKEPEWFVKMVRKELRDAVANYKRPRVREEENEENEAQDAQN